MNRLLQAAWLMMLVGTLLSTPTRAAYFDGMFAFDTGDYDKAYQEWRAEASKGDPKSMFGLGQLYEDGLGVDKDPVLAYVYYDLASLLGFNDAISARDRIKSRLTSADVNEARKLQSDVKKTGRLPPESRAQAQPAIAPEPQQTQPPAPAPEPAAEPAPVAAAPAAPAAAPPAPPVSIGKPLLELTYACQFRVAWRDKGSGGKGDLSLYEPVVPKGHSMIGGYAQGNYGSPHGCVAVVRATGNALLAAPAGWKQVWSDKGSGSQKDGSVWQAMPASNDYVCLGAVGQAGYAQPRIGSYACVHRCMVTGVTAANPVWTDEGTGARSQVAIYALPATNAMVALPTRKRTAILEDLNPFAACVYAGP